MRRREFITLLGGTAAAWPLTARAQQSDRIRRVGVLMGYSEEDLQAQRLFAAFRQGLTDAGWTTERNLQIEVRWTRAEVGRIKQFASELVALKPDVILSNSTPGTAALKREARRSPSYSILCPTRSGPVFITSLSRPGGNITGFINLEAAMGGKWLELLKEAAPGINHAAIMFNPDTAPGGGRYFQTSFEAAGLKLGVKTMLAQARDLADIERAIANIASVAGGGLVVMTDSFNAVHRRETMNFSAAHKLPTIFPGGSYAREGGLLGYGPDNLDLFARSASYVARVLKGDNPGDLPVQVPRKFELVINLKTANSLGLAVPPHCKRPPMRWSNDPPPRVHHTAWRRGCFVAGECPRSYPNKPIRLIVPFLVVTADIAARIVTPALSKTLDSR